MDEERIHAAYDRVIDGVRAWLAGENAVEAAMIIGSRAREDHPADAWSDLDIVLFANDPGRLTTDQAWIARFGTPLLTYLAPTPIGPWHERRVIYEGGIDVDFAVLPAQLVDALATTSPGDALWDELASVIRRGSRVLLDRQSRLGPMIDSMAASPSPPVRPPDAFTFAETVNTFWYQAHWIAKKLRRGELAVAHECLDGYARMLLRTLIRWHAERAGDTWHKSRFMEEWADAVVIDRIPDTYALHTREDIFRALGEMMDLVGWLTREIAATYGFVVPEAEERAVRELVAALA